MRDNYQKIKLLRLYEILQKDSSEEKPLRTSELCERLESMSISCDRRTLARDIQLLNEFGYEIGDKYVSREKGYYALEHEFDDAELQILIDAVEAANFITKAKTKDMTEKLARQSGGSRKKLMNHMETRFSVCKHSNEAILNIINELRQAIHANEKVQFNYFDLGPRKDRSGKCERIMRKAYTIRDGERVYSDKDKLYTVEPLALVFNEDNYYMVAYNTTPGEKTRETVNYRVDRMCNINWLKESISEEAARYKAAQPRNKAAVLKMFNGDEFSVRLEFKKNLLGAVYDRFGEGIAVRNAPNNDEVYRIDVDTAVTGPFFGWVAQFGPSMRILGPDEVIERYVQHMRNILQAYHGVEDKG